MMSSHHINTISKRTFDDVLSHYPSSVPEKLRDLDALRYESIPATLATRNDGKFLGRDEVEKLVEWKLKHGTFRPKLLQLVQSNEEDFVTQTTKSAFSLLTASPSSKDVLGALDVLTKLKGIGPATASLLLSVAAPEGVPFFSDELFKWCMWDESGSPGGWKRGIKYNKKEYGALVGKVGEVRERLGVRAVDVERVAWVLGKEGVDCGVDGDEKKEQETTVEEEAEKEEKQKPKKATVKSTKRKVTESKPNVEGTRKSARTKK